MKIATRSLVAAMLAGAAHFALAHAHLVDSQPANGAAVSPAPTELRFKFTEPLELGFSSVKLVGPGGRDVEAGKLAADESDPATVTVLLPTLGAGAYTANWSAVAKDGHRTQGAVMFTVK